MCHRQLIDISIVDADFSVDELTAYRSSKLELTSMDRVYCVSLECAKITPCRSEQRIVLPVRPIVLRIVCIAKY